MRTYEEIKAAMLAKGLKWFDGDLNLNLVFERVDYVASNHFTDWWYFLYQEGGENKIVALHATTKPGIRGSLDRVAQPLVDGVSGTPVIMPGQYRGAWEFIDIPVERAPITALEKVINCPYFRQVGPLNYWRDGNRDAVIDEVNEQDGKEYSTHLHPGSNETDGRPWDQLELNNWYEGCMGSPRREMDTIFDLVRRSVAIYGKLFTGTILESTDFN